VSPLYARLVVALRVLVPVAGIAAAVLATISLPELGDTGSAPLDDLVSGGGAAAQQQQAATQRFGFPLYTDTMVVQHAAGGLPAGTRDRVARAALAVGQHKTPGLPQLKLVVPISDPKGTTVVNYLYFADAANLDERRDTADRYAQEQLGGVAVAGITGAAPARLAQYDEIQTALPLVEAASVALILLIVGLAFRSFGAPLITLFTAGIAYAIAIRVLPWAGERTGASVPAEVEPIIIVLLLGLVTDYSVFFLSETRRRMRLGEPRLDAARAATARTAPIVFTAGLIVAAGTGALVVGELGFFRAFGPGLALTTLIALVVSITLVPALVALFGGRLFKQEESEPVPGEVTDTGEIDVARRAQWFSRPVLALRRTRRLAAETRMSTWRLAIARVASMRPVSLVIAVTCIAVLGVLALGVQSTRLGLGFVSGLPPGNEVHRAADAAAQGFAPGIVGPTEIDLSAAGIAAKRDQLGRLEDLLAREPGVSTVIGPREQPQGAPAVLVSKDGGAARLAVVFDSDPTGAQAIDRLDALRDRLPDLLRQSGVGTPQVLVGGETVVAQETVDGVLHDLRRIGLVALAVNLLLLMLFLRAIIAPLYLMAASVLGLGASLGITTFFFQDVLGHDDLTYYVPFAAAVLLVALGSDYNVFVAGRIWEEARRRRLREAISVATPAAAKAVTVAGIALAASFALLVAVPLVSFREFAFVMAVGVLVDTFIVRSLLVPALTSLFGEASWWPGRRVRPGISADAVVDRIAERTNLPREEAELVTEGTLAALGERISARERRVLTHHLPPPLDRALNRSGNGSERFPVDEFLDRARARAGGDGVTTEEMRGYASAVLTTLEEAAPDNLAYVRAQLSDDYDPLFDASAAPAVKDSSLP
jgi:putative drug exporter of the RND superfamily